MFNRDRAALQVSGLGGENSTWAGEGIVSGIYKNLSFSAGYIGFETDGFRTNNDQKDKIANIFAQWEITPKTSIQAGYRYRDTENGDLQLRFFADDFDPNLREEDKTDSIRLGFRHAFSPALNLIGNFMYSDAELSSKTRTEDIVLDSIDGKSNEDAYSGELQYLFRSELISLVAGGGYFNIGKKDEITTDITILRWSFASIHYLIVIGSYFSKNDIDSILEAKQQFNNAVDNYHNPIIRDPARKRINKYY